MQVHAVLQIELDQRNDITFATMSAGNFSKKEPPPSLPLGAMRIVLMLRSAQEEAARSGWQYLLRLN